MSLAEAQALLESATFLSHDPEADAVALQTLAHLCYHYSPAVGLEQPVRSHQPADNCLVLDVSGCGHLFGGESGLARQLIIDLSQHGYFAHAAIAHSIGAAWAVARYGHRTGGNRRLKSLPVEALRIPDSLSDCLHEFDLRTVGQLKALPKDSLPSRFGTILTERLDQLFAHREELLVPLPRSEPISVQWETEEPICHREAVRHVCEDLLDEILFTLKARGEGLLQLVLTLESDTAEPASFELNLTRPTDSVRHVRNLLDLKLETQPIPEWLITIRMKASVTAPLQVRQQRLFDHDQPDHKDNDVRKLIERLSARLGRHAVVRPQLLPEAVPEQAIRYESLTDATSGTRPKETGAKDLRSQTTPFFSDEESEMRNIIRPLHLFPKPESIEVTTAVPDGPPVRFHWNRRSYQVVHSTRAERISANWWQDTGSVHRDYYQAEIQSGARFWLFRTADNGWFLHGMFE